MPLEELAAPERIAGISAVTRKLRAGQVRKVFLAKDVDAHLLRELVSVAEKDGILIEWVERSQQLGRACAVSRRTAVAALLKK